MVWVAAISISNGDIVWWLVMMSCEQGSPRSKYLILKMGAVKMCEDGFLHKRQLPHVLALQSGFGDVIGNVAGQGDAATVL